MKGKRLKRIISGALAVTLCVAMNINPIGTLAIAFVESGIIDEASTVGKNIIRLTNNTVNTAKADSLLPTVDSIINVSSCECKDYSDVLNDIRFDLEYEDGSQLDTIRINTHYMRNDIATIKGYTKELVDTTNSIDATTKAILKDTDYIIQQLGYDPNATGVKPKNVKESFERVSDQLDSLSHEYRVANIKSINNMFAGALWKPKFDEVPNLTDYCEITGGFANTYSGYWDTSYDESVESVLPTEKALEELGYDAILRAEGIIPVGAEVELGKGNDQSSVSLVIPYGETSGGAGSNVANEVVVYDENGNLDVTYNDYSQITGSYNVSEQIPTSQLIKYEQITMPSNNVTYLDAVTLLYKALGEDIVTLEGLYTRNPDIEVESSPLAKQLAGVVDEWEGYDYYVFATRSNPISYEIDGDTMTVRYDYAYWRKAVSSGFVNYKLRDEPISAVDFCTLAAKMMQAYGEPELTDNELQTLLQVYGSYYPIQMGDNIALSWAYLKARGIITDDNFPEIYTSNLSRDQMLDMCARIKNPDLRATYKNIQLAITLDDVVVDKGVYPYYDFAINRDGSMFLETTVDYTTLDCYTYMFPMTTDGENSVNLGYGGAGFVYTSTDFTTLVEGAMYNGMIKLDDNSGGHYYYVVQIPTTYNGNAYLRFVDVNDQERDLGTVSAIELNPKYMTGGIFTQYDIQEENGIKLATLSDVQDGFNWYSFNTQPNNMDLIWFGDAVRCNATEEESEIETVAFTTRAFPTFSERLEVAWNNLTEPYVAYAAEDTTSTPSTTNTWHLEEIGSGGTYSDYSIKDETNSSVNVAGYVQTAASIKIGGSETYFFDNGTTELERIVDSAALTALQRASTITRYGISNIDVSSIQGVNRGLTLPKDNEYISFVLNTQGGLYGKDVKDVVNSTVEYHRSKNLTGAFSGEYFASVYYLAARRLDQYSDTPNNTLADSSFIKSLKTSSSKDDEMLNTFNEVFKHGNRFTVTEISDDGKYNVQGNPGDMYKLKSLISNFLKDDLFNSAGDGLTDITLSNNLESSVLMDRDNHVYIAWEELVEYGIAKSLNGNGKPKPSTSDGVYEFYTNSGVVRVDDTNKIIQIGSQIYSFQYEDTDSAPSLVWSNKDGTEIYFDVRCITGVSNSNGYTLDEGKAKKIETQVGEGSYTILTLSAQGQYNKGSMNTSRVEMKPFGDSNSTLNPSSISSNQHIDVINSTIFDGGSAENNSAGSGTPTNEPFVYWRESDGISHIQDAVRMTLSSTVPTANWIFVTNDDGVKFSGKLYVAYLRQPFQEGFVNDDGSGTTSMPTPSQAFLDEWTGELLTDALSKIRTKYPDLDFESYWNDSYGSSSGPSWALDMTKCALANLSADTGVFWTSPEYYWRVFDFTNASCADNYYVTDFRESDLSTDESTSNEPGSVYFLDYLGYVYNMPKDEDFTLTDYYTGKYLLPLSVSSTTSIINYNMNYYGHESKDNKEIPMGVELTASGFIPYRGYGKAGSPNQWNGTDVSNYNNEVPFNTTEGDEYIDGTFCAAPAGVYMRFGLFRDSDYDVDISKINSTITDIDEFYIGTRRVLLSTVASPNKNKRYWTYASAIFGPMAIPANTKAEFCHKYLPNFQDSTIRSSYIIKTNAISNPYMQDIGKVVTLGMITPEVEWNGRAKLVSILDAVDQGTNWWIWLCLTLAPMICVILMTILIGMSFLTESKIWQRFCEKCFDPVRILTFGARDSNTWSWRKVLIPCLITYIAFALLCNANILKIIIYVVDGWMKIMSAI